MLDEGFVPAAAQGSEQTLALCPAHLVGTVASVAPGPVGWAGVALSSDMRLDAHSELAEHLVLERGLERDQRLSAGGRFGGWWEIVSDHAEEVVHQRARFEGHFYYRLSVCVCCISLTTKKIWAEGRSGGGGKTYQIDKPPERGGSDLSPQDQ